MSRIFIPRWAAAIACCFIITHTVLAQQNNISYSPVAPNTAVQTLLSNSSGVIISNVTYSGDPKQIGQFTGAGGYISVNEGIILATGHARLSQTKNRGPYNCVYTDATLNDGTPMPFGLSFQAEVAIANSNYDPDLGQLGGSQYNPVVLEFDFVPNSDGVSFDFVFASDEYEEYVGSPFNDVFGFFVSGPGINGTYSNGGVNIAVVPVTGQPPISVNTVNHITNSMYFVSNVCNLNPPLCPSGCCPCPEPDFQYDGFTTTMTASITGLQCTSTYHIKLAITNIGDSDVGSAVFLKAGSFKNNFQAGPVSTEPKDACEGNPITLSIAGNPSYQYVWTDANGLNVSNTQSFTTVASLTGPPYTVTVTDPVTGCVNEFIADPTISVLDNEKPYTKGINNNGHFEYYVPAGVPFTFEVYSFDADNEELTGTIINLPFPSNYVQINNFTQQGMNHPYYSISGTLNSPGEYTFQVYLEDDNSCGKETETYTYKIIVLCPDCYGTTHYEKRGLNSTNYPWLPFITEVTGNIIAGYSVDPAQANGNVYIVPDAGLIQFIASESVLLQPGFIVEPGGKFIAKLGKECDGDCNDCCSQPFTGFTVMQSEVPNFFTPNGDGINDYWYIPDPDHSNCAFNIQGFHLTIYNREGGIVHDVKSKATHCCSYKAPGPLYPNMQFSSIFWDGRVNYPNIGGPYVSGGTYDYVLTLYGCNDYEEEWSGFFQVSP